MNFMKLRSLTIAALTCILMLSVQQLNAADPSTAGDPWTYIEEQGQELTSGSPDASGRNRAYYGLGAEGPGFGSSLWTYADSRDTTAKAEGSYAAFMNANGWNSDGSRVTGNLGTYSGTRTFVEEDGLIAAVIDTRSPRWLIPYSTTVDTDTLSIGGSYADATAAADIEAIGFSYTESGQDGPPGNYSVEVMKSFTAGGTEIWLAVSGETSPTTAWLPEPYLDKNVYISHTGLARGPHSGLAGNTYPTTGNKCKTCHAVHRAGGVFKLTRTDSADDACSYCHVDDHRHASRQAYNGNSNGIYTQNGHTVGAGRAIPGSSVRQWLEPFRLTATTQSIDYTWDLRIRRYETERQRLYVYTGAGSSAHSSETSGTLVRYGPTLLTCMSCHQPHNAVNLIWKPSGAPAGYKLLRSSPSGSLFSSNTSYPLDYTGVLESGDLESGAVVHVPETSFGPANTGHDLGKSTSQADSQTVERIFTTWSQWKGETETISPEVLSPWCADCHNLEIAANEKPEDAASAAAFRLPKRGKYLSDRTHTSGTNLTPCYSCHRTSGDGGRQTGNSPGWESTASPAAIGDGNCDRCHYRAGKYVLDNPKNDFPHSGASSSRKLLFDWYQPGKGLDQVCRYCHNL